MPIPSLAATVLDRRLLRRILIAHLGNRPQCTLTQPAGYFLEPAMTPSFTRDEVSGNTGAVHLITRHQRRVPVHLAEVVQHHCKNQTKCCGNTR